MLSSTKRKFRKVMFHLELGRFRKIADYPAHIQIEPTVRCNLNCVTCTRKKIISTYKKMDIGIDEIDKILSCFPRLKSVKLQGLGEPLLCPQIEDILKKLKNKHIKIWIISNGTLFDIKKYRDLVLKYVDDIAISFDSTNKKTFKMLRPYADMDKIKENIKLLVQDRNVKNSDLIIGINFVISHKNYFELNSLYDLAVELGIDYVGLVDAENWTIKGELNHDNETAFISKSRKYRKHIDREIEKLRLKLLLKGIILGHKDPKKRLGKCYWPFKSAFINVEGFVTPCCTRMHRKHSMGNVTETDFNTIWNSQKYIELRQAHINKDISNLMCGNCPD